MTRRSQWVSITSLVTSLPVWVQEVNRHEGVNESAQSPLTMSEYLNKSREVKTRTSMILHDDQVMLFRTYLLVCVKITTHRNHKGNVYDYKCVKDHMMQARNELVMWSLTCLDESHVSTTSDPTGDPKCEMDHACLEVDSSQKWWLWYKRGTSVTEVTLHGCVTLEASVRYLT